MLLTQPNPNVNLRTARPVKVAALGYYGFQNLGDEAVLAGIRQALGAQVESDFLVLTADAASTTRLHPGVRTVERWRFRAVADALRGCDLFVFGGGSLLQDTTSVQSVIWYTLMALLARRRARRLIWWAQGIGPLTSPLSRRLVRLIAGQADALTVRDIGSAELLKQIGVRGSIHTAADPAFALSPPNLSSGTGAPLLALRAWKTDDLGEAVRSRGQQEFSSALAKQAGENFQALPMHLPDDREYIGRTLPNLPIEDWAARGDSVTQVLGKVARAPLVVAMRLHALIFAARCGVPFVALGYDPKVDALCRTAGQEDALLPVEGVTADVLLEKIAMVAATANARRAALSAFALERYQAAQLPARIAADLL